MTRFGIKHKMVLSISIILVLAIGLNLVFSQRVLEKDKTAYIFENGLNKIESSSDQFTSYIQKNINILNIISSGGLNIEDLSKIVSENDDVDYLSYRNKQDQEWTILKNTNAIDLNDKSIQRTQKVQVIPSNFDGKAILAIETGDFEFHMLISLRDINLNFMKDKIFSNALVDNTGKTFLKTNIPPTVINGIVKNNSEQGTLTLTDGKKDYLVSYSKRKDNNYTFLNVITKESAFFVFKALMLKNIFFSMSVLGGCLLLTILFSNKIIIPILELINQTKEIARGNFDTKITINTNDELKILGDSVNHMSSEIQELLSEKEVMIEKLQDYNENLEKMVAERTAELQSANNFIEAMINSLDQGLFVFDENGNCSDIYTKATEDIFEVNPKGQHFSKVLKLDDKEIENFNKWSKMLFANMLPFDSAKQLGIKERTYQQEDDFKSVKIQYFPMKNEEDKLTNVVTVATDVTSEVKAIQAFQEKDAYVSMILKLIKNRSDFFNFIDESKEMLNILISKAQQNKATHADAMIVFHTMNGTFATFHVSHISLFARQTEQLITESTPNKLIDIIIDRSQLLLGLIEDLLEELAQTLGMSDNVKEVKVQDLIEFKQLLDKQNNPILIENFTERFEYVSMNESMQKYVELVEKISERINKPMKPIIIKNGDYKVDQQKYQEFFNSLVHLFRNCMDHGIEDSMKREELQKDYEGQILIEAEKIISGDEKYLQLKIQDDGGGLDTDKIRQKMIDKGVNQAANYSDKQLFECIFLPDFSTKDEVTELSGRGIGMSAIKDSLDKIGGKLEIESKKGKGSAFTFLLPL